MAEYFASADGQGAASGLGEVFLLERSGVIPVEASPHNVRRYATWSDPGSEARYPRLFSGPAPKSIEWLVELCGDPEAELLDVLLAGRPGAVWSLSIACLIGTKSRARTGTLHRSCRWRSASRSPRSAPPVQRATVRTRSGCDVRTGTRFVGRLEPPPHPINAPAVTVNTAMRPHEKRTEKAEVRMVDLPGSRNSWCTMTS